MTSDRYDPEEGPETHAESREVILASDGDVSAEVTIETSAPNVEAASTLCNALSTANESIVDRVFRGDQGPPQVSDGDDAVQMDSGDDEDETDSRIMDWDGVQG